MQRGLPQYPEPSPDASTGNLSQRDSRQRRSGATRTNRTRGLFQQFRQDGCTQDTPRTTLVGADSQRGVALGMLDIGEALRDGHPQVGNRHVVLQIEILPFFILRQTRNPMENLHPRRRVAVGTMPRRQHRREIEVARCRPDIIPRRQATIRHPTAAYQQRLARQELRFWRGGSRRTHHRPRQDVWFRVGGARWNYPYRR